MKNSATRCGLPPGTATRGPRGHLGRVTKLNTIICYHEVKRENPDGCAVDLPSSLERSTGITKKLPRTAQRLCKRPSKNTLKRLTWRDAFVSRFSLTYVDPRRGPVYRATHLLSTFDNHV